jgi:hypothetical protein
MNDLVAQVAESWLFDTQTYPGSRLDELSEQERYTFAIRHVLLHMQKSAGYVATAIERAEHGENLDMSLVGEAARKSFRNALRLAALIGLTEAELRLSL